MILNSPYISGSLTVTGNTTIQGQLTVTGSLSGTASLASNALLLQGTGSTGFATTASINEVSASQQSISASLLQVSASYIALSGSYNVFSGSASTRITENSSSIQQVSASQQQISASYIDLSGSYNTFSGSASTRITVDSASLLQVSSSQQQISASYIALSGSYTTFSGSASTRTTQIEQVYATTGSNSFRANQSITGSLVVSSTITAQTLVVQTVTSSILYSSGSNNFGNQLANTQTFTGSVNITGSLTVNTTGTEFQVNNNGVVMGNVLTDNHSITGSLRVTGSNHSIFGNVLIGSTNAAGTERFGVTRDDGVTDGLHIIADFNRSGASSAELILGYYASGSAVTGPVVYASNSQPLLFAAGAQERMRITSGGLVGIGTVSPLGTGGTEQTLHLSSGAANYTTLYVTNGANSVKAIVATQSSEGVGLFGMQSNHPALFVTNDTERMRITSAGNVGIGTSTPDFPLVVKTDASANSIKILGRSSGDTSISWNSSNNATQYAHIDVGAAYFQIHTSNSQAIEFYTSGSERMRITSAGQIGINTTSPVSTSLTGSITIYKAYNADGASVPSTTAQTYYTNQHGLYLFGRNSGLSIISANSEDGSIKFGNASTNTYATIGTTTGTSAVGGDMFFRVGSDTERMRIASNGVVTITGSIANEVLLNVKNTSSTGNGLVIAAGSTSSHFVLKVENYNGTLDLFQVKGDGTVKINQLTSNGTVSTQSSNGTLYVSSDANLKIEDGYIENGLEKVLALKPRYFYWKDKEAFSADRQLGFYAQEVNAISEETANTPAEGYGWGIYDRGLVALLTKAIQEQQVQIQNLQEQINELKAR